MAISTRLLLNFKKSNGELISIVYNDIKQDVSAANVKTLMEGIVANGSIFEKVPATIVDAKIITTEATAVDLS